jgi:hypothetical protein
MHLNVNARIIWEQLFLLLQLNKIFKELSFAHFYRTVSSENFFSWSIMYNTRRIQQTPEFDRLGSKLWSIQSTEFGSWGS